MCVCVCVCVCACVCLGACMCVCVCVSVFLFEHVMSHVCIFHGIQARNLAHPALLITDQKKNIELRSLTYPPSKASTLRSVNKGGGGGEHTVAGLGRLCEQIQTYIFSQLCTHARMHAHARTRACMTQKRHGLSSAV